MNSFFYVSKGTEFLFFWRWLEGPSVFCFPVFSFSEVPLLFLPGGTIVFNDFTYYVAVFGGAS
jgi:hypothetical protein